MFSVKNIFFKSTKKNILNDITFEVDSGEILGIVGKNGVGKSTLLKIISGQYIPSKGHVDYSGNRVGFLIEEPGLYEYKTGLEHLNYYLEINRCNREERDEIFQYIKILGTSDFLDKKIKNYSQGMKQKLGILTAIVGRPSLIILDEPTNSLDFTAIVKLRELVLLLKSKGYSIILTSHILTEIEKVCDKVIILDQGQIIRNITLCQDENLLEKYLLERG